MDGQHLEHVEVVLSQLSDRQDQRRWLAQAARLSTPLETMPTTTSRLSALSTSHRGAQGLALSTGCWRTLQHITAHQQQRNPPSHTSSATTNTTTYLLRSLNLPLQ